MLKYLMVSVGLKGTIQVALSDIYYYDNVMMQCYNNLGNSLDSNTFGPVSAGLMTARATYIVWPPSRWQRISSHLPSQRKPISLGKSYKPNEIVTNGKAEM